MTRPEHASLPPAGAERTLWTAAYVVVLLLPFAFMVVDRQTPGRTFPVVLSAGLGFTGLTVLALQLVMPSRARSFSVPFGIDVLLRFHRQMGQVALVLVVGHVAVLMVDDPGRLALLNPVSAPWRARAGVASLLALVVLLSTSLWRTRFGLRYEGWRALHVIAGLAVLGFAFWHVLGVAKYVTVAPLRWATLAFVLAAFGAVFYLRVGRPFTARARAYRVESLNFEPGGVATLQLRADGHRGVAFAPGQFAWIKLARAPYSLTEHPFSFASSAARPDRPMFAIRAIGDFTTRIRTIEPGALVLLDGPHGSFRPARPEAPYLLIVAGIGITPALSVLRTFADERDPRRLVLLYGNRRNEDIAFADELETLTKHLDLRVVHVLSDPTEEWRGERGRIDQSLLGRLLPLEVAQWNVLICGPPAMVTDIVQALARLGVPRSNVHAERFDTV